MSRSSRKSHTRPVGRARNPSQAAKAALISTKRQLRFLATSLTAILRRQRNDDKGELRYQFKG